MGESNDAHTQFVKDAEEIRVAAQRLDPFHRDEQRDSAACARPQNLRVAFANGEAFATCPPRHKAAQSDPAPPAGPFPAGNGPRCRGRRRERRCSPASNSGRNSVASTSVRSAFLIQIHRQIEMKIDQSLRDEAGKFALRFLRWNGHRFEYRTESGNRRGIAGRQRLVRERCGHHE